MLGSRKPAYHPKLALVAMVLVVLIVLIAGFAMLSTIPTQGPRVGFPSLHRTMQPPRGNGGSVARDAFRDAF